ncbi:MAG: hypothetical protein CMP11_01025, partial [Zetaproteobacteria bacterium]|nr:hypothetical protein [Pseudobdellovibrionaceae bacterium]
MNIFKHSVNLSLVLFFLVLCAPVPQQNADQSEGSSSEKEEELAFNLDINNLIQSNPNAECDDVTGSTITEWVKRAKHWDVCYNNSSIKFDKWDYLFGGYNKGETTLTVHGEYNKDEDTNAKLTVTVKKNESWVDDQPCSSSKRDKQKACLKFECVENNKIQISCVEPKKSGDIELLNAAKKWVKGDKDRTETVENEKVNIWGDLFQSNPVNFWYGMCPFNLVPAAYLDSANKVKGECNTEGGCLKVFKRVYQVDFDEYSDNSEVEKWPSDTIGYKGEFLEFKDAEMTDRCVDDNQCYNDQVKLFEDERNITCRPPRLYSDLSSYKKISNYSENIEINDPKKIFKTKTHVIINTGEDIKYVGNLALISDRIKDANDLYISDRNISRFTDNEVESVNVTIDDELMEKTNSNFCQGKPLHYSFDHFTDDIYEKMYGNEISGKIGGAILYKIINILNYSLNAWGNKEMNTSDQSLKEILIKDPNKKIRKLDRFDVNKEIGNEGRLMQFFEKTINNNFYPK